MVTDHHPFVDHRFDFIRMMRCIVVSALATVDLVRSEQL